MEEACMLRYDLASLPADFAFCAKAGFTGGVRHDRVREYETAVEKTRNALSAKT